MRRLAALFIALIPALSPASPLDYAYKARLGEAEAGLQRVRLEAEIILSLARADLGDIAVYNADDKPLLHSILRSQASTRLETRELVFHQFSRFQRQPLKTVTTREQTRRPGSMTERVTTESAPQAKHSKDYLVELDEAQATTAKLVRIELRWSQPPADQILKIRIEAGSTLDDLYTIEPGKSLSNFDASDPDWRSIEGIPSRARYLRLTAVNDVTRFELQRVIAHYEHVEPAPVLRKRLMTEPVVEGDEVFYRIAYPSQVHAQSLRILPATPTSLISGRLYGRWGGSEERRLISGRMQQHNITGDAIVESKPIPLPQRPYRDLVLSSDRALPAAPAVELIYPQYELLFLGDGNGPYTLVWGNHGSSGPNHELAALLNEDLTEAQRKAVSVPLGNIELSGGLVRLAPQSELPWTKWSLWALLGLAVMVTARMAVSLYRQMNANPSG